jgi:trypsin-like peptidase
MKADSFAYEFVWSMTKTLVIFLVTLFPASALAQNTAVSSGSGIVIGNNDILTNYHVVDRCANISIQTASDDAESAVLVARDQENDLAIVRTKTSSKSFVRFREGSPIRVGDTIYALGYPLSGVLASGLQLSVGIVNALAGLNDDSRHVQISAPVQPGNSGGPLLDTNGHLVGIVTSKLNAIRVARFTGDIPQNVNFAIKAEVAKAFLESRGFKYQTAVSDQELKAADVADLARPFTAFVECRHAPAVAAIPPSQTEKPVYQLEKGAGDFVAALFAVWSGSNSEVLPAFKKAYADEVAYYGKLASLQAVLDDKQAFIARWPQRSYRIVPGGLSVECDAAQLCMVSGLTEWIATNGPNRSSGIARFKYVVKAVGRLTVVGCQIQGYFTDALEFTLLKNAAP